MRSTFVPYFSLMLILESVNLNLVELSEHRLKWIEWYQKTITLRGIFFRCMCYFELRRGEAQLIFIKCKQSLDRIKKLLS